MTKRKKKTVIGKDKIASAVDKPTKDVRDKEISRLKEELAAVREELQATVEKLDQSNEIIQQMKAGEAVFNEELHAIKEELTKSNQKLEEEISVRMWAEDAVQKERKRLFDVFETLPAYLTLLTPDCHILYANRFFKDRFGENFGMKCYEHPFERTGPCEACETYTVFKTRKPHHWEWTGPDHRNYDVYDFPFTDVDGSPLIMKMGIDVTELKKAQADLREANETLERRVDERTAELFASESRYRNLFDAMSEGFSLHEVICDVQGKPCDYRFLEVNPAFERLTGLKRKEILGKTILEAVPGIEPIWIERFGRVALTGKSDHFKSFSAALNRWYETFSYQTRPGRFAVIFMDVTERKEHEKAIRKSKEEWEKTFDSVPDLIAILDPDHLVTRVNKAMADRLGLPPESCMGIPCYKAVHGTDSPPSFCPHMKTIADNLQHTAEVIEEKLGGNFLVSTTPMFGEDGKMTGSVHVARDITDIRRAQEELNNKAAELEAVFEAQNDGILIYDAQMRVKRVNPSFVSTYGFDPAGLSLAQIIERVSCRREDGMPIILQEQPTPRGLKGEKNVKVPYVINRGDGTEAVVEGVSGPMKIGGHVVGSATVWRDITEQRRAEASLKDARKEIEDEKNLLQAIINGARNTHLVYLDADFNFVFVNEKYAETCGFTPQEMVGKNHFDLYPHDENEAIFKTVRDEGLAVEFKDKPFVFPDQPERGITYWDWMLIPVKDDSEHVKGLVFSLFETTQHKRQEQELRKLNRTLRALGNVNEAMLLTVNEEDFLNRACRIIEEDCGYTMVWIGYKRDDEARSVYPVAWAGFDRGYLEGLEVSWAETDRGAGPAGTAVRTGKISLCPDISKDPRMASCREEAVKHGYASSVAIPLKSEDGVLGVLAIYSQSAQTFSEDEVALLTELTDNMAFGIVSIRSRQAQRAAEDELRKSEARLRLLSEVKEKLLTTEDPQGIVEILCRKIMDHLDCHAFFNFLVNEEAGKLHLNAYAGIPSDEAEKIRWLDFGVAVCGCAARDKMPIIAQHIPTTPDPRTELVKSYGIRAYACHPMMIQGRLVGTLSFGTCTRDTFSTEDLALMKTVTFQIGTAMDRIRLIEDLHRSQDELEARVEERTAELQKVNLALQRSNKALGEFAYVASHDLQEPLRKIQTFSDRLSTLSDFLDDKSRDYLARMQNAAGRMRALIQDLLVYSRLASNPKPFELFNLKEAVDEAMEDLGLLIAEVGCSVEVGELPNVLADKVQMAQLFRNLISNALKYHGEKDPFVKIYQSQSESRRYHEIHIQDNGIGFDQMYVDKIFYPFQRLHGRNDAYQGTGIGLAICRRIVENHGGRITARSEVGKGSTFKVELPNKKRIG